MYSLYTMWEAAVLLVTSPAQGGGMSAHGVQLPPTSPPPPHPVTTPHSHATTSPARGSAKTAPVVNAVRSGRSASTRDLGKSFSPTALLMLEGSLSISMSSNWRSVTARREERGWGVGGRG